MLENQINAIGEIIKNDDVKELCNKGVQNLFQAIINKDILAGIEATSDFGKIIFNTPTLLLWSKFEHFFKGTFKGGPADQMGFAKLFNVEDENKYKKNISRLFHTINTIDDETKIDYFANLSRCAYINSMDIDLFWYLTNYIKRLSIVELDFLKELEFEFKKPMSPILSLLECEKLVYEVDNEIENLYGLSSMAKTLKWSALNWGEDGIQKYSALSFEEVGELPMVKSATINDIIDFSCSSYK